MMNKLLTYTLSLAIIAVAVFAFSLTSVHGNITVTFGKQPAPDVKAAILAMALPVHALRSK